MISKLLQTSGTLRPLPSSRSACRSFEMISSDPCRFCPIKRLLSGQSPNDEFSHSQWIKFRGGPQQRSCEFSLRMELTRMQPTQTGGRHYTSLLRREELPRQLCCCWKQVHVAISRTRTAKHRSIMPNWHRAMKLPSISCRDFGGPNLIYN